MEVPKVKSSALLPQALGEVTEHSEDASSWEPGKLHLIFLFFNMERIEQAILDMCLNPFSQPDSGAWQGLHFTVWQREVRDSFLF